MFPILLASIVNGTKHTKYVFLGNQNVKSSLLLLTYILMNTVKNCSTIHLQLN